MLRAFIKVFMNTKVYEEASRKSGRRFSIDLKLFITVVSVWAVFVDAAARGDVITYNYDETTSANGVGRLTSVTDSAGSGRSTFAYDVRGNVTKTVKSIDANTYIIQYTYDSLNRLEDLTYPDGEVVRHRYNSQGLLDNIRSITYNQDYVINHDYSAQGQVTQRLLGNNVLTTYDYYDNTTKGTTSFRLRNIKTALGTNPPLQDLTYSYDEVGNVSSITEGATVPTQNFSFDYDNLHRLTSAVGPYSTITYAYNNIGNMICNSQVGVCSATSPNYTYPASGFSSVRPHAVTQAGANTYTYDANGNMIGGAGRSLAYDAENRSISITMGSSTTTMVYDYSGDRVKKTANGVTNTYVGSLWECTATCTKYIFAGPTRIAMKDGLGQVYYYHSDHLGSSTLITKGFGSDAGSKIQDLAYFPYGQIRTNTGSIDIHHKFTGQELDGETNLYYYGARYYDPVLGRFIQADTGGVDFNDPQTLNPYRYGLNNPLRYIDPSGNRELDFGVPPLECDVCYGWESAPPDIPSGWNFGARAWGLLNVLGGGSEAFIGGALGVGTSWTGIGGIAGAAIFLHGSDVAAAGLRQAISGQPVSSFASSGLQAFGLNRDLADTLDASLSAAGSVGAGARLLSGIGRFSLNSELKLSGTLENQLNEVVRHGKFRGELDKPFLGSPLTAREIMGARGPIPDPHGIPGGLRWDVPGTFRGQTGTWELVIDTRSNTIVHWDFRRFK